MQPSLILQLFLIALYQFVQNTFTNFYFLKFSVQYQSFSSENDSHKIHFKLYTRDFTLSEYQDKVTLVPTSKTVLFAFPCNQSKIGAYSKPITFEINWPWQYQPNEYKIHFFSLFHYSGQSHLSCKEFTISPAYKDFL